MSGLCCAYAVGLDTRGAPPCITHIEINKDTPCTLHPTLREADVHMQERCAQMFWDPHGTASSCQSPSFRYPPKETEVASLSPKQKVYAEESPKET